MLLAGFFIDVDQRNVGADERKICPVILAFCWKVRYRFYCLVIPFLCKGSPNGETDSRRTASNEDVLSLQIVGRKKLIRLFVTQGG